jgi:hypothetical protein
MSANIVLPYLSQGIKEFDYTGYSNNECRANGSFLLSGVTLPVWQLSK